MSCTNASPQKEETSEVSKDEEEECEDEDIVENSGEDEESLQKAKQAITCRSVTLNTLMEDGIISHGKGVLSIDYLGQRFEADLLETGKIKWHGSHEEFNTPSAWALHCKRLVNPIKRSGCGWASVKYKSRKLDIWKSMWARKHRTVNPFKPPLTSSASIQPVISPTTVSNTSTFTSTATAAASIDSDAHPLLPSSPTKASTLFKPPDNSHAHVESDSGHVETANAPSNKQSPVSSPLPTVASGKVLGLFKSSHMATQEETTPLNLTTITPGILKQEINLNMPPSRRGKARHDEGCMARERKSVLYSSLGTRGLETDLLTLVKCEHFDQHSKIQPFTVSITSNTLLLMDFHCHLTKSEVVGYLGGRWDSHTQHLSIEQAFPARCRLGDKDRAPLVEEEIRRNMRHKNQMVVGWYHSHPYCQPDPSIRDVDCQMSYQLKMRGSGCMYLPCLGFIISPFEKLPPKPDSKIQSFWVMPNLEHPASYNIPMHVSYSIVRDSSLTEDLLSDMKQLTEFYRLAVDKVNLKEHWGEAITYKDKIKASLRSKLPEDQLDSGTFLDYVQQLLTDMR
ncbi:hypothetical protein BsWGS_18479 [Bradybaena similaris]